MIRLALALAFLPAAALAEQSRKVWPSASVAADPAVIEMHAPTRPDSDATITFWNEQVHEGYEEFDLTFDGITVEVLLGFNVDENGSERVTVMPPDGYVALPAEITVPEHQSDEIQIVKWRGG